jgi:predicted TIM-barrel enzyme
VLGAGAGTGLVAKAAAAGGADFIAVYCTSKARLRGYPTSIIGDPNGITLELLPDVIRAVGGTPVVAGIHATDPTRDTQALLQEYKRLGCSGVINYPSSGLYGPEYIGGPYTYEDGLEVEAAALETARSEGLLSMTYLYRSGEARLLAPASDVVVAHAGWTLGGMAGAPGEKNFDTAAATVNEQIAATKKVNAEAICLAHGGPFSGPEDMPSLYQLTGAVGFVGASSIERIPVERAVADVVARFKQVTPNPGSGKHT